MSDYSVLAQRVSLSITGVRGCLMLSRDGMILGAHPEGDDESALRAAWVRFAGVGDPERSYVEFPDQIWAFVRRGSYGAFAVADVGVRPGVLVDMLEQALMAGEQERANDREMMRLPDATAAPVGQASHRPAQAGTADHGGAGAGGRGVRGVGSRGRRGGRDAGPRDARRQRGSGDG